MDPNDFYKQPAYNDVYSGGQNSWATTAAKFGFDPNRAPQPGKTNYVDDPNQTQDGNASMRNNFWMNGQAYNSIDPSELTTSWAPKDLLSKLITGPGGEYLLPNADYLRYGKAAPIKDDSAMMWSLGAGAMGGLPMAAHGAFGSGLQNFLQNGTNPFSGSSMGAPVSDIFPSFTEGVGQTAGVGAEGSVSGIVGDGGNPFASNGLFGEGSNLTTNGLANIANPQGPMSMSMPGMSSTPVGSMGTSGGFGDFIKQFFPGLGSSGSSGSSLIGDVLKAGGNYFLQSSLADKYQEAALAAASKANTLDAPQRQGYQGQLSQLLSNPAQFYATNPVVKAQLDVARQQFEANTGKMGTGGTQFNNYLKNVQNVAASTFNDQAQLLSVLGGFNQGAGYSGNVYANMSGQGIQQQGEAYRGIGDKDVFNRIFGGLLDMSSTSPSGTKITSSY